MKTISRASAKSGSLTRAFQEFLKNLLPAISHGGNDGLFALKVAVDKTYADTGFGADIVHARLVKATFGEARESGAEDLVPAVLAIINKVRHWKGRQ